MVFHPFAKSSDYFPPKRAYMLNRRAAMLRTCHRTGTACQTKPDRDDPANGHFGRLHAPERNPIKLWQPRAP